MDKSKKKKYAIKVKDLYKIYMIGTNKVRALNGVDFAIEKGTFCCIVGTSGSGKSTLLNMMAGLEPPTKGEIIIAGEHMERKNEAQLVNFRQAHVGFIFQSYNLLPNMTAIENIALPLTFQGMDKAKRIKKAKKALKLVGLQEFGNHRPGQMSGGQQQRVGIARALVVNPEIIFADEPTGNLDSNTTLDVLKLIKKIVAENKQTVVMVTHDNNLASYGDMIIHIKDGKITEIEQNRQVNEDLDNVELGGTLDIPSEMSDEAALSAQPAEIQPVSAEQDTATDQAISEGKQAIENVTVPSYEGYHPGTYGNDPGSA
ncbi:MAG: ABC transporter ATP-binding protein [Lachnospiraceae bacterium]|nr:ABC transporter ATP-binding protein [Lachnospiraceae bacterium]